MRDVAPRQVYQHTQAEHDAFGLHLRLLREDVARPRWSVDRSPVGLVAAGAQVFHQIPVKGMGTRIDRAVW